MDSATPVLSVVIPAHNEVSHLEASLGTIQHALECIGEDYEVIVVDDGSSDDSWAVLVRMVASNPRLRAFRLSRRFGKEAAICAGLTQIRGQAAVVMDSDLQHPPALLHDMYRSWKEEGYEVVEAVKAKRHDECWSTRLGAPLFYQLFRKLSGIQLDGATDFKLMDRKAIDAWAGLPERAVFFRGMAAWIGFRRKQLHFVAPKRSAGTSQWSAIQLLALATDSLTSFSALPIHVITFMGTIFLIFAAGLSGLAFYYKLIGLSVSGFTTVIILQLMIGSMLMIGVGTIGQYIAKIYEEVKGRPRFIVAESAQAIPSDTTIAPMGYMSPGSRLTAPLMDRQTIL